MKPMSHHSGMHQRPATAPHGALEETLHIGARVMLRASDSDVGVVAGVERGKVRVFWLRCRNEGRYKPRSLIQVTGAVKVKFFEKENLR